MPVAKKKNEQKRKRQQAAAAATCGTARRRSSRNKKSSGFDVAGFLDAVERDDDANGQSVMGVTGKNRKYSRAQVQIEARFRSDLKKHYGELFVLFFNIPVWLCTYLCIRAGERYKDLLKEVKNPFFRGSGTVPKLYTMVSGRPPSDREALELTNRVMIDWARVYRKLVVRDGATCPYYEPSSTMTAFRSLFAYFGCACGWEIGLDDLKGFPGSLDAVLTKLFADRQKKYVS